MGNKFHSVKRCKYDLVNVLTSAIEDYAANDILKNCRKCKWSHSHNNEDTTLGYVARRTRFMDRIICYAEQYELSHADVYNIFYCVIPVTKHIVRINKRTPWEITNDWGIYDIYARLAIIAVSLKLKKEMNNNELSIWEKKEMAEIERDVRRNYEEMFWEPIFMICDALVTRINNSSIIVANTTVGDAMSTALEHFSYLASSCANDETIVHVAHFIMYFTLFEPRLIKHDIFNLVYSSVNSAVTFLGTGSWGSWYQVKLRSMIRKGVLLDSDRMRVIEKGSLVHVIEHFGRRVQVNEPVHGFCSLHDGSNSVILEPNDPQGDDELLINMCKMEHVEFQMFRDLQRWAFSDKPSMYLKLKFSNEKYSEISKYTFQSGYLTPPPITE